MATKPPSTKSAASGHASLKSVPKTPIPAQTLTNQRQSLAATNQKQESRVQSRLQSSVTSPRPLDFESDDGTCSMVIICEGKKLYCHKDFLCIWSPVMKEICYPEQSQSSAANKNAEQTVVDAAAAEMNREPTINNDGFVEIELEEGNYEEMKEFLYCLYPPHKEVTDENVDEVVALASEYKTEQLKSKCEEVLLLREASVDLMLTAETFELAKLREDVAKRLGERSLQSVEEESAFEELGEESKMMIWREMATHLESQQEEIDDLYDSINKMIKVVIRATDRPNKSVRDKSAFGNVSVYTRDAKGKKKKETIPNAVQLKIDELNADCKESMKQLGSIVKTQISYLDNKNKFDHMRLREKQRQDEHFCHGYFKYKPSFYSSFG